MRILFINHAFPGIFGDLAAAFGRDPGHEVVFASGHARRGYALAGVRHVPLQDGEPGPARAGQGRRELENVLAAGRAAGHAFMRMKKNGFAPDMVLASACGAYGLFWEKAFPAAFRVSWTEGAAALSGSLFHREADFARNLLLCRQALGSDLFVSLTAGQESRHALRPALVADLPYAVNTEWFAPSSPERLLHGDTDLAAVAELVVVMVRGENGRNEETLPAVALLLAARRLCHVVMLCGNMASLSSLKQKFSALPQELMSRIHVVGMLSLRNYRNLLALASVLLCPAGVDMPPSIMLEAMSCETALLVPEETPVSPLLRHGENMFSVRLDNSENFARNLAALLANASLLEKVRKNARATVLSNFDHKDILPLQMNFLLNAYASWKARER